jgi:hypothetical protein
MGWTGCVEALAADTAKVRDRPDKNSPSTSAQRLRSNQKNYCGVKSMNFAAICHETREDQNTMIAK